MCDDTSIVAAVYENSDEAAVGRSWLAAARAWTDVVRSRVMEPFRTIRQAPDPVMVLSANGVWVEELNTRVRPTILGVMRRAVTAITGAPPPDGFDESAFTVDYLDSAVNRMSGVPDEVFREIADQIAQGVAEGESIADIAARVDEVLTVTGSERWANRSVVVARTEVTGAVNAGSLAGAARQQITDRVRFNKTWLATTRAPSSNTTRPAHLKANGQTVPLTQAFLVGGEPLQYPGDPAGSAGNVIQCRCTLTFAPSDMPL